MYLRKLRPESLRRKLLLTETSCCFPKEHPAVVPESTTSAATARIYWTLWNFHLVTERCFSWVTGLQGLSFDQEQRAWLTEDSADNLPTQVSPSQLSLPVSYSDLEVMLVQNQHCTFSTNILHLRQREGRRRSFTKHRTYVKDRYKNPWWDNEVVENFRNQSSPELFCLS